MIQFTTAAWCIALVYSTIPAYWLIVHPLINFWRRRGATLKGVGPLWALLWVLAGIATYPWLHTYLYRTAWSLFGLLLNVGGFYVYRHARQEFSTDQVLGRAELEPHRHEQRLVTRGIRGRVRHPYYLGHFLNLTGLALATGSMALFTLWGLAVITGPLMLVLEERELVARFGDDYRGYQRRVPAIFPRLR